jgi:hypothetical protein
MWPKFYHAATDWVWQATLDWWLNVTPDGEPIRILGKDMPWELRPEPEIERVTPGVWLIRDEALPWA